MGPVLFSGRALFWGAPALQFHPWRVAAWEALRAGDLPLWNPLLGMGAPLLANYQSALFYPPNWLYFLLAALGGEGAMAWGQALIAALHLICSAAGMALLVRRLGLETLSQAVAGLAFGLSGYLVARLGFLSINASAAWLPWVLLACLEIRRSRDRTRPVAIFGLVFGLQLLSGHAQTTWYTLLLALAWTTFWAWEPWRANVPLRERRQRILETGVRLAGGLVLAAALAAVQLGPTAEYLAASQRSNAVDYEFAMTYSFWPWRLLGLLAPDLFGSPVRGDYWGYANYWEDAVYIGILPLLLAVGVLPGALRARFGKRPASPELQAQRAWEGSLTRFLLGIVLMAFILAFGANTPIFPWLYRQIPTFDMFQAPTRFSLWAEAALALLAALGAQHLRRPEARPLYWARLATAGACAVGLGAGLAWLLLGSIQPTFIRATALAGGIGVGAGLLILRAPPRDRGPTRGLWESLAAAFVMLDLVIAGWGLNPGVELGFYTMRSPNAGELRTAEGPNRLYLAPASEHGLKFEEYFLFSSFQPGRPWPDLRRAALPNLNVLDGLPHTGNFDPLLPGRYVRWMEALPGLAAPERERLLALMAVGWIEQVDAVSPAGVRFDRLPGLARARWAPCAHPARDGDHAWDLVMARGVDLARQPVVEGLAPDRAGSCPPGTAGSVWIEREGPNSIVLRTQADREGWLLLADVWYPGWRAHIDGAAAPVYPANYLFRAVPLPAGEHRVVMSYRPASFYAGAALTTLSGLLLAGAALLKRRRRPG